MNSLRSGRCECESLANCQQASCQHFNSVFTPAISCWKLGLSTAEHLVDNDKLCHNGSQWATTLNTSPPTTTRPLVCCLEFSNLDINVHNIQKSYMSTFLLLLSRIQWEQLACFGGLPMQLNTVPSIPFQSILFRCWKLDACFCEMIFIDRQEK